MTFPLCAISPFVSGMLVMLAHFIDMQNIADIKEHVGTTNNHSPMVLLFFPFVPSILRLFLYVGTFLLVNLHVGTPTTLHTLTFSCFPLV